MSLRAKQPVCVVCSTPVSADAAVQVVGKVRVFVCAKHEKAAELTVSVGRAAVRAGVETALEARFPGALGKLQKMLRVARGEE